MEYCTGSLVFFPTQFSPRTEMAILSCTRPTSVPARHDALWIGHRPSHNSQHPGSHGRTAVTPSLKYSSVDRGSGELEPSIASTAFSVASTKAARLFTSA